LEGPEKVSGRAVYAADVVLPGMLWGKVLRSPISYGRIKNVDASRALGLPGVHAVATGKDIPGRRIGRKIYDMPILADGVVRFIGEKVAAVAAESEALADQAIDLIEVEYEEMEPILDPLDALAPGAALLHPDVASYRGLLHPIQTPSNAFVEMHWKKGDVETGFREADVVLENTFRTKPVHQAYLEPHACVVRTRDGGHADIWTCSKVPFALREQIGTAFGKAPEAFTIHPCYIGGCFGGKGDFMDIPVCTLLSMKSARPVKMVMDYSEEFVAGNPRHAAIVRVKSGVTGDGRLLAHQLKYVFDSGAYAAFKPQGYLVGPKEGAGPYNIPNVLIEETIVYTNKIPCGHMRAPGDPQAFFANESQMDLIAKRIGMDPVVFRQKNLLRDGGLSPIGQAISHIKSAELVQSALEHSGYRRLKKKHTGRGIGLAHWLPHGGECHAFVDVDTHGTVTVSTAMLDQGAGTHTAMRLVAAEELKTPLDLVRIATLDTSAVGPDTGIGASRGTRIFGQATRIAAAQARNRLLEVASQELGVACDQLLLSGDGAVRTPAGKRLGYGRLAAAAAGGIRGHGFYKSFETGPEAALCAQIAEVEVDIETGRVTIKQFTTAHSTGTVINPLMHQGQIDGGIVMGLGYALMEEVMIDGGKVVTTNFGDSKIPCIMDIPPLKTIVQENPVGSGPYGGMSIGEPPVVPTAAAIANAIDDAVGARIFDLPITAEKVFNALKAVQAK
jgi:carbon-monoxide dehydrogenase large subunit